MAPVLALAGFMGSGKSTVASLAAQRLGWSSVDLDQAIESYLGVSIAECFDNMGEAGFRDKESEMLERVLDESGPAGLILALGGGTLERERNRLLLKEKARVLLLEVEPECAWQRVAGTGRPLARDVVAFRELWARRQPTYEAAADWILPTGSRDVGAVVAELCDLAQAGGTVWPGLWGRRLTATERSSLIIGGVDALTLLGEKAEKARAGGSALHVVSDENVMRAWGPKVLSALGERGEHLVHVMAPGEESKSHSALQGCWEWLAARRARRDDIVVALGGGVIGDLAGFAAATYHRGIGLWQVPTSLLAQVDSSVGGKTAINLGLGKNLVGAFYQADLVVIDPGVLKSLPDIEYTGALGEVVKHALLTSEEALLRLEAQAQHIRGRDLEVMSDVVKRNVWFKCSVVQEDERESGRRAVLNLGHTTAHALESALGYGRMNHGQAVALGLLVALSLSEELFALDVSVRARTTELLGALGLDTKLELPAAEVLLEAAGRDKKVKAGTSGFVGLRAAGEPVWGVDVSPASYERALEVIRS